MVFIVISPSLLQRYAGFENRNLPVAVFLCILDSGLQGHFVDVGSDHGSGNPVSQKVDAQIAVVATHVSHPITGSDKLSAEQKPVGNGYEWRYTGC